jgi:TatD DNase family protein
LASQTNALIERAAEQGVGRIITVATTPADAADALRIVLSHENVFMAAGIHPHEAGKCTDDDLNALSAMHRDPHERLVAVGETGLDFHYDFAPRDRQEEVFRFQLALACEIGRPVVIHAREAEQRACQILSEYPTLTDRVVFHCFSANSTTAQRIVDMGYWLSFTGIVTFPNADEIRRAARLVPDDRIMVETDAPYMSPVPVRKIRPNEPAFAAHTARFLAELRGVTYDDFAAATTRNAERFFGLCED